MASPPPFSSFFLGFIHALFWLSEDVSGVGPEV